MQRKRLVVTTAAIIGIAAGTILGSTIWNAVPTHAKTHVVVKQATWHGLPQVDTSFIQLIHHAKVKNAQGKTVTLADVHKPILFSAPWCPFCAKTEKLLVANHLMSKVQIIGVALDGGGKDLPFPPMQVTNANQAQAVFARDWKYYNIKYPTSKLDFAMPGSPLDKAIKQFPFMLIPHNGEWYANLGYNPSATFWRSALG